MITFSTRAMGVLAIIALILVLAFPAKQVQRHQKAEDVALVLHTMPTTDTPVYQVSYVRTITMATITTVTQPLDHSKGTMACVPSVNPEDGSNLVLTAVPATGYEVDYWYISDIPDEWPTAGRYLTLQTGGNVYTLVGGAIASNDANTFGVVFKATLGTVATPTFSPAAGAVVDPTSVTISCATGGATKRYTTDGSIPTKSYGTVYTVPVVITANTTLKAIAYLADYTDSAVASAEYVTEIKLLFPFWVTHDSYFTLPGYPAPVLVANDWQANAPFDVYLENSDTDPPTFPVAGTTQHYLIVAHDAAEPTVEAILAGSSYSGPWDFWHSDEAGNGYLLSPAPILNLTTALHGGLIDIWGVTTKDGYITSDRGKAVFRVTPTTACDVVFGAPPPGTYIGNITVGLFSNTEGASIYYTLNGATPDNESTLYTGPFTITSTKTVKAIAHHAGMTDSAVTSGLYTINASIRRVFLFG